MMKNVIKDINKNCKDLSVEGIVRFLENRGDLRFTANSHREVYYFFLEALDCGFTLMESKKITVELFDINPNTFKNIRSRFKGEIKSKWESRLEKIR